jgi:cytoskeleton protein RodZ
MSREAVPGTERGFVDSSGSILRKARVALGLTEEEVATELRLSAYQIRALEADDYDDLPGTTYVRGYLRAYARLLNLNVDSVMMSALNAHTDEHAGAHDAAPTDGDGRGRFPLRAATVLLLLLLIGVLVLWWYSRESDLVSMMEDTTPLSSPDYGPASGAGGHVVTPVAGQLQPADRDNLVSTKRRAVFRFGEPSWIDVRDGAGKVLVQRTVTPGLTLAVEGNPPFRVFLGNAAAVQVHYAGESVDVSPRPGSLYARFTLGLRPPTTP